MERYLFSSEKFSTTYKISLPFRIEIPSPSLQSLNGVKLVLPVIFAMLLSTNAVACLALSAALLGCTLVFSLMYCKIYGNPPGTSVFLW
jgi:hypothetical protein